MSAEAFLDTNILVYAVSSAADEEPKRKMSEMLIENVDFGTSAQVLQEFYNTVTRKIAVPLTHEAARSWLEDLAELELAPIDADLVMAGADIANRYQTSYWDGAIIAAAERIGAKTLYTEDLNHGQAYGSVTAINPYITDDE